MKYMKKVFFASIILYLIILPVSAFIARGLGLAYFYFFWLEITVIAGLGIGVLVQYHATPKQNRTALERKLIPFVEFSVVVLILLSLIKGR